MTIQFNISHAVAYGEELLLNIIVGDSAGHTTARIGMSTLDGELWTCHLDNVDAKANRHIDYYFSVDSAGHEREREWTGLVHRLDLTLTRCENMRVECVWNAVPTDIRPYTSAFAECLARHTAATPPRVAQMRTLRLIVRAPHLRPGERLAVAGADRVMGAWDKDKAAAMTEHSACEWQADINAGGLNADTELQFVAVAADGTTEWEAGGRRTLHNIRVKPGEALVCELCEALFDRHTELPARKTTTVAKLRTNGSFGVGDFGDLAALVSSTGETKAERMIVLPPVNDTVSTHTDADATPYSVISVCALHPLLCDLRQLPPIADRTLRERMEALRLRLNALPHTDYSATLAAKADYLHAIFCQEGDHIMRSSAYRRFFANNEHWLVPYAQYSYLRDAYTEPDFRHWPSHTEWTEAERGQLQNQRTKAYKKLAFIYYVQFVLHTQLCGVHSIAREHGIVLAGDTTANVNPNGCDVWQSQDKVGSDEWWARRLAVMANYYDACRVAQNVISRRRITESTRMWLETFD